MVDREPQRVEIHRASDLRMDATKIYDQGIVDEHPHVVIANKREDLAASVGKVEADLGREEEI